MSIGESMSFSVVPFLETNLQNAARSHDGYHPFVIHQRLTFLECACRKFYGDKFWGIDFIFFNTAETIEPDTRQAKMIISFVKHRLSTMTDDRGKGSNLFVFDYSCARAEVFDVRGNREKMNMFELNDHHMVAELESRQLLPGEDAPEDLDWENEAHCRKRFLKQVKFFETPGFYPGELPRGE